MKQSLRKHFAEFSISMVTQNVMMCSDIKSLKELYENTEKPPFHIYFVVRRPKIVILEIPVEINSDFIEIAFQTMIKDKHKDFSFKIRNDCFKDFKIKSDFPYAKAEFFDGDELLIGGIPSLLLTEIGISKDIPEAFDLEVMYIGQAFGKSGERTAIERLEKHSTLQEIYRIGLQEFPDQEILTALFEFQPSQITTLTAENFVGSFEDSIEKDHLNQNFHAELPFDQLINLTEACLIKYFQPNFNVYLKNKFPDQGHVGYRICYELDLNSILCEIDCGIFFKARIWSSSTNKSWFHFIRYPFDSPEERRDLLDEIIYDEIGEHTQAW